jgi:hypothetical protein
MTQEQQEEAKRGFLKEEQRLAHVVSTSCTNLK